MGNLSKKLAEHSSTQDELPPHKVVISSGFWMSRFEIKQSEWLKLMRRPKQRRPQFHANRDYPARNISYLDCLDFIEKLNYRESTDSYNLPTEAQWEYACRAGTRTPFNTGNHIVRGQANLGNKNYDIIGEPGGMYKPNALGLHDMHGNMAEWCLDYYSPDYYKVSPLKDPTGPSSGKYRVIRGGHYHVRKREDARSANRQFWLPNKASGALGLRLVYNPIK